MANNIGLDFGTTYSVISFLKDVVCDENKKINQYTLATSEPREGGHSSCQDSIVAINEKGRTFVGLKARQKVDEDDVKVFKGFKMLLSEEESSEKLKERHYTDVFSPSKVTELYISSILNEHIEQYLDGGDIDKLVVGVPEIWFQDPTNDNLREKLEDIIMQNSKVKKVQLVSEPALACAYFADNYKKKKGYNYVGRLLLIDYGGGTLDIALCDVKENGRSSEISVLHRTGIGVNDDGIGIGGVLYLETVINKTLSDAGFPVDHIEKDNEYYKCIHDLEDALMINTDDIGDVFDEAEGDWEKIDEKFKTITYKGEKCFITYGTLAYAYNQVISVPLGEKLEEMLQYMRNENINCEVNDDDDFKIALVGGFCNFYLTRNQIENTRGIKRGGAIDVRYNDVISNKRDCEKAIAYGAALIANDIINFKQLAPYTLSIVDKKVVDGKNVPGKEVHPIIISKMELQPGVPVMAKNEDGSDALFWGKSIPFLRIDFESGMYKCKEPSKEIKLPGQNIFKIGFSFDQSTIIYLHVVDLGPNDETFDINSPGKKLPPKRLADIETIFGGLSDLKGRENK